MYSYDSKIRYSECDDKCRLKLEALMNYFQDASTFQSEELGVGIDYLVPRNLVWVLISWQIEIERLPGLCEEVEICTFPTDFKGFMGTRNFFMRTKKGEILAKANTLWTLLNFDTMKPAAPPQEMLDIYPVEPKLEMTSVGRKIVVDAGGEKKEAITVRKQHLDSNHHVNNTQYVSMAMECLPEDFQVAGVRVEYKQQAHLHDVLVPYVVNGDGKSVISLQDEIGSVYVNVEFTASGS